jgi:hypothetical protein
MATYSLYLIRADLWQSGVSTEPDPASSVLRQLIGEAVALRRRIEKGANLEAERLRYSICLGELESRLSKMGTRAESGERPILEAMLQRHEIPVVPLAPRYFDLMTRAHLEHLQKEMSFLATDVTVPTGHRPPVTTIGSSIFPPDGLSTHITEVEALLNIESVKAEGELVAVAEDRIRLLGMIRDLGVGAIEVVEELDNHAIAPPIARPETTLPVSTPNGNLNPDRVPTTAKGRRRMMERLEDEIEEALPTSGKVNMSNQPHEVSTEVLGQFVRASAGQVPGRVRVTYADGSEAKPFPLRILPMNSVPAPANPVEISVALMSMRHLELDPMVDWAWYRNKEVSQTRPLAESDEFCFQYSLKQLTELHVAYAGRALVLNMYHTGFEPAAIAFYRAVAITLMRQRGRLRVVPHYFRGGTHFAASEIFWE